jgi:hypothetical protein
MSLPALGVSGILIFSSMLPSLSIPLKWGMAAGRRR